MDEVYVYAGNLLTGEVCSVIVENDDDLIYDAAERFNESFDYAPMVWAVYDTDLGEDQCDLEFNNYFVEQYDEYITDLAS